MKVVEIFESMQGEGFWMGRKVTFIRLCGCNLKCPFCDEASKYDRAQDMTIAEIVNACHQNIVVITGGEPTIQDNLKHLIRCLKEAGHHVHVETNGTGEFSSVHREEPDWITVSPKRESDPPFLCKPDPNEIKLVVDGYLIWQEVVEVHLAHPSATIWLQPCDGEEIIESRDKIKAWLDEWGSLEWVRAGIQLHKWYGAL